MVEVQSRIGVNITGPEALGAEVSGRLEVDFFGTHQDNVRLTRLRLAYVTLNWENTELMAGLAFHPMFVLDCFPGTLSFAAAVPFHTLNRSPLVRVKQSLTSDISASLSFITHGYHRSVGPTDAQRNSGLPDTQLQIRFGETRDVLVGFTAGYKWLSPRDTTLAGIATDKIIGSYNLQAFTRINTNPATIMVQGMLGENMTNFTMIGGYGAKADPTTFDPRSDYDYTNLKTLSVWTDIRTKGRPWEFGLFAGYTENLGSNDNFTRIAGLTFFDDLNKLFRVSPRVIYRANNLSFGFEYSFFSAVYTDRHDINHRAVSTLEPAVNHRFIFQTRFTF